ncbi:MAG: L-erythro-3,5-diaminohexanoate dehydrogenase, partial [Actinomycetota bacterium]
MERFGTHRSLEPAGVLPQQALRLDATAPLTAEELAIDVDYLNIDSASWRQLKESTNGSADAMAAKVQTIVDERGKMHNPVTGSGGMLVGTVSELGAHRSTPAIGTQIATLVSLSLTPLVIDEIIDLDPNSEQVKVKGKAILFGSGIYAEVPGDLPGSVTLSVLDVCGAPAWMARLARPGMKIVVIGAGGRSGMLACAQATRILGDAGQVLGLCYPAGTAAAAQDAGAMTRVVDCTDALAVAEAVSDAFMGDEADLVFVCTNVAGCEGGAILSCSDQGRVVFFSMATVFTTAALLAEGLGKSCEMSIGNGYVPGHAELALDLVRNDDR